jgi:hypothetical protein
VIDDLDREFMVTRPMAIALCDSVLRQELKPDDLRLIGFALVTSDKLKWDWDNDDVLGEVLHDWACPEVNIPLSMENVLLFKSWLRREAEYPIRSAVSGPSGGVVSETRRVRQRTSHDPPL